MYLFLILNGSSCYSRTTSRLSNCWIDPPIILEIKKSFSQIKKLTIDMFLLIYLNLLLPIILFSSCNNFFFFNFINATIMKYFPQVIEISNECAESVRLIAKVHYNLCKISKFINSLFSGIFVVIVVTAFFLTSSSLYFIFIEVVKEEETSYSDIGNFICWQITSGLPIIMAVIICNWTSNEVIQSHFVISYYSLISGFFKSYFRRHMQENSSMKFTSRVPSQKSTKL